ncbi:amidohydrolase family protein [Henriciella aquimarina]|uniref:amidohydrolase family protein n=1 Tax=Henriciella aquimarina TaxID=545261 RepID=UPI000A0091C4|nr:amidohydrolase family protein [Henriciella aquimarina]
MRFSSLVAAAACFGVSIASAQTTAFTNGRVLTAGQANGVENATVLIEDDQIVAVGQGVTIPADAEVVDASGKVITPGFIVASTTMGAVEINDRANANDIDGRSSALSAGVDIQYAINPASTLIPVARSGGVSRAVVTPGLDAATGANVAFGGQAALISTTATGETISEPQVAVTLNLLGSDQGRGAVFPQLKAMLEDAAGFAADPSPERASAFKAVKWSPADLMALVPVMRGEVPLFVTVQRASDISALLDVTADYDLRLVLVGASEAWKVADRIADTGASVVLNPADNLPGNFNEVFASSQNVVRLAEAGVEIALIGPRAGHDARLVRYHAGLAAANGLPKDTALRAITSSPARMLGLVDYGEIAPGQVADIAVWSGDPFEPLSDLEALYISGERQPLENRQTVLREKYSGAGEAAEEQTR